MALLRRLFLAASLVLGLSLPVGATSLSTPPVSQHPGYVSGNWYPGFVALATAGAAVGLVDTAYCHPLVLSAPATITGLGVRGTAAGTSAFTKLAVYTNSPTTHRPGTLIAATGAIAASNTSMSATLSTPVSLAAGYYWECSLWTWSVAPSAGMVASTWTSVLSASMGGSTLALAIWSGLSEGTLYTLSGLYTAGFPATLSGLTSDLAGNVPFLGWSEQ